MHWSKVLDILHFLCNFPLNLYNHYKFTTDLSNCHNYIIISVRRNCRELFLVSMFVSFEFILAGNECICTNVILLWSLHSSVLLSITMWLSVRRLAVSDRDSLAQYTCRCSIKYHMMSHWSALIIRVSYCKIVCLNYLEAEDWKTSQKE